MLGYNEVAPIDLRFTHLRRSIAFRASGDQRKFLADWESPEEVAEATEEIQRRSESSDLLTRTLAVSYLKAA